MKSRSAPRVRDSGWIQSYSELHRQVLERDGWRCQVCGACSTSRYITSNFAAIRVATRNRT